jgi:hypothetical protein
LTGNDGACVDGPDAAEGDVVVDLDFALSLLLLFKTWKKSKQKNSPGSEMLAALQKQAIAYARSDAINQRGPPRSLQYHDACDMRDARRKGWHEDQHTTSARSGEHAMITAAISG